MFPYKCVIKTFLKEVLDLRREIDNRRVISLIRESHFDTLDTKFSLPGERYSWEDAAQRSQTPPENVYKYG